MVVDNNISPLIHVLEYVVFFVFLYVVLHIESLIILSSINLCIRHVFDLDRAKTLFGLLLNVMFSRRR